MKLGLGLSALGILTLSTLAGCGGHRAAATRSPASENGAQESAGYAATDEGRVVTEQSAAAEQSAPASAPAGVYADRGGSPAPKEEEAKSRPGLGTSWGESLASTVSNTTFVRENDDAPSLTASFFYNDE